MFFLPSEKPDNRAARTTSWEDRLSEVIEIPGHGRHLADVRRFLESLTERCGFSPEDCYDIKVAVGEACSNAIEHGSPQGAESTVRIHCYCRDSRLTVEVCDEGRFKPRVPVLDGTIEHRGRGIPFMLALMDEVDIVESTEGTRVRMVKRLGIPAAPEDC